MASTAAGMARIQLRHLMPSRAIVSTPSCSYSTALPTSPKPPTTARRRHHKLPSASSPFSTTTSNHSSWPAGATDEPASSSSSSSSSSSATTTAKGKAKALTLIPSPPRAKTIADLHALKHSNTPIVCLTAHDFPTALSVRSAAVDLCLIGDSLANVALGFSSTQPLSLDAMIHHCQAVKRGLDAPLFSAASLMDAIQLPPSPLVIADMPFGATFGSIDSAVAAVVKLIQHSGVDGVKIEGSYEVIPLIQRLTDQGIPVMGHLGLQPQRVGATSGYRVQAKTAEHAKELLDASLALQNAGCFSLVLECIPTRVGEFISQKLAIPTIGIGAGSKTDGQILVMNDMLADLTSAGHVLAALAPTSSSSDAAARPPPPPPPPPPSVSPLTPPPPKFVRNFSPAPTSIGAMRVAAVQAYTHAVRNRTFPNDDVEGYKIKSDEWKAFLQLTSQT